MRHVHLRAALATARAHLPDSWLLQHDRAFDQIGDLIDHAELPGYRAYVQIARLIASVRRRVAQHLRRPPAWPGWD